MILQTKDEVEEHGEKFNINKSLFQIIKNINIVQFLHKFIQDEKYTNENITILFKIHVHFTTRKIVALLKSFIHYLLIYF